LRLLCNVGADPFSDAGADEDQDWIDAKGSFIYKPAWQRLLIVAAGPLTNLILPILVFTGLYLLGEPQPPAEVGSVERETPAAAAGLAPGDKVRTVNGAPVIAWGDLTEAIGAQGKGPVTLEVERASGPATITVAGEGDAWDRGISPYYPDTVAVVDDSRSPAGRAGLHTRDRIQAVDGVEVTTWVQVEQQLAGKTRVNLTVVAPEAGAEARTIAVAVDAAWAPQRWVTDDDTWAAWGIAPGNRGIGHIGRLPDGTQTAAQCSGLKEEDRLLRVGERDVWSYNDVVRAVARSVDGVPAAGGTAKPVDFVVRRDGVITTVTITPDIKRVVGNTGAWELRPIVGLSPVSAFALPAEVPRPYPFREAVGMALTETGQTALAMLGRVGEMITGDAPVSQNLGGPIEVFSVLGHAAEQGLFVVARQFAALSLSLGVINLLPIPVLDGGQIVTYAAEWVRGRPLPYRLRERLQQFGLLFLVGLLLVVTVMDIQKHSPVSVAEAPPKCD
jgi:regulator of sigma E protease